MSKKLERRQGAAIAALLNAATIQDAAREAGISESTLRRWMKLPEFRAAFREAQDRLFDESIGELHGLTREATETL
nr:helix-turn-helix domain-containing protein [Acidobacteriota bacterium]